MPKRRDHLAGAKSGATILAWLAWRSPALAAPGDVLDVQNIKSRKSDAELTRTPTDFDLLNACEQWLGVSGVVDSSVENFATPRETPEVRDAVRVLLSKSAAFARLSSAMQSRIARDMVTIADHLVPGQTDLIGSVDFPNFIADLVTSVFNAIVNTSIRQMDAYADLVAAVAAARQVVDENVSEDMLREHLCDVSPPFCDPPTREEQQRLPAALDALGGTWRRLAKNRQQLLARMVLMGINRTKLRAS